MTPLEQKIRKHYPELQALTFGCEVKIKVQDDWFKDTDRIYHILGEDKSSIEPNFWICEMAQAGFHPQCFEIIGHPIEWSHVLRAIEKSGKYDDVCLYTYGMLEYVDNELEIHNIQVDLSLPFSEQSPEVHKFINDLID
jgi:hypothetical protein